MAKPKASEYYFDERAAKVAVLFFERLLKHYKGEWAGQLFKLPPWQHKIIRDIFGWKRSDGMRKYRTAYIEVPRKNGKSTLAAGIALEMLFLDDEPGSEVYSAAADREQAAIVFDTAKQMVVQSAQLSDRAKTFRRSIAVPEGSRKYEVLSSDVPTKHGLNAHCIVFDELHAQPNRDLWDVLNTSTGSRRQPLTFALTTAGFDRESVCWEQHEYARQVISGVIEDPTFYSVIYAADESDDWTDERVWEKANPNIDISIKRDYLRAECNKALASPAYQNTFRRLHLNQWTQQNERWLPLEKWDEGGKPFDISQLAGKRCYGGLDLASTSDIAAFVLDFQLEDEYHFWLPTFWIPENNMIERARRDRVPYDAWVRDGLIFATPGNSIDFSFIVEKIKQIANTYDIAEIAFDRWGAFQIVQQLTDARLKMVEFGQGYVSMGAPMKELLRLTMNGKVLHGGNKVLRWMADNMVVSQDPSGNIKPNKQKSTQKIDGMVAGVMALDRSVRNTISSVYDERGILSV